MAVRTYDFTPERRAKPAGLRPQTEEDRLIAAAIDVDVESLSPEQHADARKLVERAMSCLDDVVNSIKAQIEAATAKHQTTGEYSDPHWYRRTKFAQRHKGKQRQLLQGKLGEINRRIRAHNNETNSQEVTKERMFIKVARLHLPAETYQKIWDLVNATFMVSKHDDDTGK